MVRQVKRAFWAGLPLAASTAPPLCSESITYDGDLFERGAPASGFYDFRFALHRAPEGELADRLGDAMEVDNVDVREGRFRVHLDFGEGLPGRGPVWLAIEVAGTGGAEAFERLEPAQRLDLMSPNRVEDNFPAGAVAFFDLLAPDTTFETFGAGLDGPGGSLPYLQPLACRKN